MVHFEHCASHHLALVAHTYHSSTSRYTYLTAMRHACPPTRHSSHFMRITSGGCTQITTSGTLLPSSISSMLLVILQRLRSKQGSGCSHSEKSLTSTVEHWRQAMNNMSHYNHMRQIALYLLCWGESAKVRFVPRCLCFIFKCADDYYRSPKCQNCVDPVPVPLR